MRKTVLCLLACLGWIRPSFAIPKIIRDTTAERVKPLTPFIVPNGTTNIALRKPVTASVEKAAVGTLSQLTDGEKGYSEGDWLEVGEGPQWVQIDLLQPSPIFGIHIWFYYGEARVYRDVVVRVSNDRDVVTGVQTLHNDDQDNSSGLGIGTDKEFYPHSEGFRIDTRGKNMTGLTARYVRIYSNGNTSDKGNQLTEVEVIGKSPALRLPNDTKSRLERGEIFDWKFDTQPAFYKRWKSEAPANLPPPNTLPNDFWVPHGTSESEWSRVSFSAQPPRKPNFYLYPAPPWHRLSAGLQWMQIAINNNLPAPPHYYWQTPCRLFAIRLWHWQNDEAGRVYHDVIVQSADDAKFTRNVKTLFNNDTDNSARRGIGTDNEYAESPNGLLIDTRGANFTGIKPRYLRFYSRGDGPANATHFVMVQIIGKPEPEPIQHPPGRPDLMIWKTKIPMASFL